jgi:hypothetical protein
LADWAATFFSYAGRSRFLQGRLALRSARDLLGDRQPVLQRRAVGRFGFAQQLFRFQFQLFPPLPRPLVADRRVFAGVGEYFGAVDAHRDLPDFE